MLTRKQKWDVVFLSDLTLPDHIMYYGLEEFALAPQCGFSLRFGPMWFLACSPNC